LTCPPTPVTASAPRVRLRRLPLAESTALLAGRGEPPRGLIWDADYPTSDTLIALDLLMSAHAAVDSSPGQRWWLHQIVVGAGGQDLVVGDIGFHGPPLSGARAVVEIGYAVVPSWRGRGIATHACRVLLAQAWRDGADVVRAEAERPASRAVLRKCGFQARSAPWFEVSRP
jgi:RimJ/RimL family protein N-acetyltransferase